MPAKRLLGPGIRNRSWQRSSGPLTQCSCPAWGIGKSELAAQYAREQAEAGKTVVRMFYHSGEPKAEDPVEASGRGSFLLNLTIDFR
ncbi:MAG: hypothetical protein ACLU9S_13890 [Oscillospiraceae bacterium]